MQMELKEAINKIETSGYKRAALFRNNEKLCGFNVFGKGKVLDKLNEIETRIMNNGPGVYTIHANNAVKDVPDLFVVEYGDQTLVSEKRLIPEVNPKLLENQKILELSILNAELRKDNEALDRLVTELENEIEELNTKIQELSEAQTLSEENAKPGLMENAKSFLESLMEFGTPLLDQHFALKQQQIEIERMKYQRPKPQAQEPKNENVKIRKIGEFVETFKDQPEVYEALHEISAKSKNVMEFMQYLQLYNFDLYEQLSE
jgi:hypothetical protein